MLIETITAQDNKNFSDYSPIEQKLISATHPEETAYYKPISYKRMIDETMNELEKRNLKVMSRRYVVSKNCSTAIAYYSVEGDKSMFQQQIGWRNSYDKTMSLAIVTGLNVFICGNGLVFGDMGFVKRHVGTVANELQVALEEQIENMYGKYTGLITDLEAMQQIPLSKRQMAELAGRLYIDEELIQPFELSKIKTEITEPTFDYSYDGYVFGNNDLYSMYQHITYAAKEAHPQHNPEKLNKLHGFMKEHFLAYN